VIGWEQVVRVEFGVEAELCGGEAGGQHAGGGRHKQLVAVEGEPQGGGGLLHHRGGGKGLSHPEVEARRHLLQPAHPRLGGGHQLAVLNFTYAMLR